MAELESAQAQAHAQARTPQRVRKAAAANESAPTADALYRQARELIDQERYDRALDQLDQLCRMAETSGRRLVPRVDAAWYWKAYVQVKQGLPIDALATLDEMEARFPYSRWLRDGKALGIEIRQATGQPVSPDVQPDEDAKLLALRGLMSTESDRAVRLIEQVLKETRSIRVKENALFVLSQSRLARAREIIAEVGRGEDNPDLQLRAVSYLGVIGGSQNRQVLDDIYRGSSEPAVKRAILRSLGNAGDRLRLVAAARSESSPDLRGDAIRQLGLMRADSELNELYLTETVPGLKERIILALFVSGRADRLVELARNEKELELRGNIVRHLGLMGPARSGEGLRALYVADGNPESRRQVVSALAAQQNLTALVALARAEQNRAARKALVEQVMQMRPRQSPGDLAELVELIK